SLIKNENDFFESDLNSFLPLDQDDVSICNSIESYTNDLLFPILSPQSTSSSTSSFFNTLENCDNIDYPKLPIAPSLSPAPSATSTTSSLSLSLDINSASYFLFNQRPPILSESYENFSILTNPSNDQLISQTSFITWSNTHVKQDVSVGTDFAMNRDIRYKKDFDWMDGFKLSTSQCVRPQVYNYPNQVCMSQGVKNDKESFKLVEKIQPKKSRTKYTKEQIDVLESAYWRNAYPDVITIEHLCKSLSISKEKINIWFQNRRARSKRHGI
ncbi:unnamed protein product, partial [Brachionus calyciflorus]